MIFVIFSQWLKISTWWFPGSVSSQEGAQPLPQGACLFIVAAVQGVTPSTTVEWISMVFSTKIARQWHLDVHSYYPSYMLSNMLDNIIDLNSSERRKKTVVFLIRNGDDQTRYGKKIISSNKDAVQLCNFRKFRTGILLMRTPVFVRVIVGCCNV